MLCNSGAEDASVYTILLWFLVWGEKNPNELSDYRGGLTSHLVLNTYWKILLGTRANVCKSQNDTLQTDRALFPWFTACKEWDFNTISRAVLAPHVQMAVYIVLAWADLALPLYILKLEMVWTLPEIYWNVWHFCKVLFLFKRILILSRRFKKYLVLFRS